MKRKILLLVLLVIAVMCVFCISVSAEGLIPLDSDPGIDCDESNVSYISTIPKPSTLDENARAVITDGTYFYVVPSYYIISDGTVFSPSVDKLNNAIGEKKFSSLKACLVRIDLPLGLKEIRQGSKFEYYTLLREVIFHESLTSISALNAFTGCSNLEYISDISNLVSLGNAAFAGCEKLDIDVVWPSAVKSIDTEMFSGCKKIRSITIPEGVTGIGSFAFQNCDSLTEIILPNTVKSVGKHAFGSCDNLVTISFGASFNSFTSPNQDFETTQNDNNLKYVYLPESSVDSITARAGYYKAIFSSGKNVTFFYAGSFENASLLKEKMTTTGANEVFANATLVEYDPNQNYEGYADTLGYSIIVYNYSACEAFYNGAHDISENYTIKYNGAMFLSGAACAKHCANCLYMEDAKSFEPLFESLGYSTNGKGSVVQAFKVNIDFYDEYESVLGEISYGVIAAGDVREDKTEKLDVFSIENKMVANLSTSPNEYFDIWLTGFDEETYAKNVFFCAYLEYGTQRYFINNGDVDTKTNSITYNSIVNG